MQYMLFPSLCEARVNSLDGYILCSSKPQFPKAATEAKGNRVASIYKILETKWNYSLPLL